jgi:hypothetical protein
MMIRRFLFVLVSVLTLGGHAPLSENEVKSGPQPGDKLPGPFLCVVANSSDEPSLVGKRVDFFEKYGQDPVVLVLAREMTEPLTGLVKKLDAEVAKNKAAKLKAIAVILADDEATENHLKDLCEKQGIKSVNLAIMEPECPKDYGLANEVEVTVIMFKRQKVEANHAFGKGKLNDKGVERILADIAKIVPDR